MYGGSTGASPLILNLGIRFRRVVCFTSRSPYQWRKLLQYSLNGGWVDQRYGIDYSEKDKKNVSPDRN
jgi:hypothetical protein